MTLTSLNSKPIYSLSCSRVTRSIQSPGNHYSHDSYFLTCTLYRVLISRRGGDRSIHFPIKCAETGVGDAAQMGECMLNPPALRKLRVVAHTSNTSIQVVEARIRHSRPASTIRNYMRYIRLVSKTNTEKKLKSSLSSPIKNYQQ